MWGQHRYRQPLHEPVMRGRTVAKGYMQWFYENGKPFILSEEERARTKDSSTVYFGWTSTSIRGSIHRALHPDASSFQPLIRLVVSVYYGPFDERIFRRSISAIQCDDEFAFTCSWTVLPFSTSVSDISGTSSSVSTVRS
ncbi:hypothetical protein V6N13_073062 [Hibiscus sabdariffa]